MIFATYYRYLRNFGHFPGFADGSKGHAFSVALTLKFIYKQIARAVQLSKLKEFYLLHSFQKLHPYN